jgi:16S rRNA processing protein RimM
VSEGARSRDAKPNWVAVARILRPRGNRGEVAAELLTDFPERLQQIKEVFIGDAAGHSEPRRTAVRSCWLSQNHRGQAVFHFTSCGSIAEAEKLRGLAVFLPIEQRVAVPAGHYFLSDLIGCAVFETRQETRVLASSPCSFGTAPALLGVVSDVQFTGGDVSGTPLLAVDSPQGELLIPLAEDICKRIDPLARRIEVALPEGLHGLNKR